MAHKHLTMSGQGLTNAKTLCEVKDAGRGAVLVRLATALSIALTTPLADNLTTAPRPYYHTDWRARAVNPKWSDLETCFHLIWDRCYGPTIQKRLTECKLTKACARDIARQARNEYARIQSYRAPMRTTPDNPPEGAFI